MKLALQNAQMHKKKGNNNVMIRNYVTIFID